MTDIYDESQEDQDKHHITVAQEATQKARKAMEKAEQYAAELDMLRGECDDLREQVEVLQGDLKDAQQARIEWEQTARMTDTRNTTMAHELEVARADVSLLIRSLHTVTDQFATVNARLDALEDA